MAVNPENAVFDLPENINLTEADILAAMEKIPGYLDITPGDFKEIYILAYRQALSRLLREVTAAEVMTREVVVVAEETPLPQVAAVMGAKNISGVPVVNQQARITGIISEKDFLTRMGIIGNQNFMTLVASCLTTKGCVALPIKKQLARDIMSSPAITITADTSIRDIAQLMTSRKVNRLPVVDAEGAVSGIVSRGDLLRAACQGKKP